MVEAPQVKNRCKKRRLLFRHESNKAGFSNRYLTWEIEIYKLCACYVYMPINAGYEYLNAEKAYLEAQTLEEKIRRLEEMIRTAPKHKGSENLLAGLKTRLKKFLEKKEKGRSVGKSSRKTIKKEGSKKNQRNEAISRNISPMSQKPCRRSPK